jgi:hypothetical protein
MCEWKNCQILAEFYLTFVNTMKNGQKLGKFVKNLNESSRCPMKFLSVLNFQFSQNFVLFCFVNDQNLSLHTTIAVTYSS